MKLPDQETLQRFINDARARDCMPAKEDCAAVAWLLLSMIVDVQKGRPIKPYFTQLGIQRPRESQHGFSPRNATIDTEEFEWVRQYQAGAISYENCTRKFEDKYYEASRRQIQNWIRAIKPRTVGTNALHKQVKSSR